MTRALKTLLLLALLMILCFAFGITVTTPSRQEFVIVGIAALMLAVVIYSPPFWRWYRKKG